MGKGSTRRKCQVSRVEEDLRWALALGNITMKEFKIGMEAAGLGNVTSKDGVCGNCLDGMLADPEGNYRVTCRLDSTTHHQWDTCGKFREEGNLF